MLRRGSAGLDPGTKPTWISRRPAPGCRSGRRTRYLFVFKDAKGMETFIESGWEAGGEVGAGVGAGKKAAGGSVGEFTYGKLYSLTKNGFQAGGALAGTKFWKDKDLN